MPPRKSNTSQVNASAATTTTTTTNDETTPAKEREGINIEDLSLPRTMVQRLAKGVLPSNTQIQKDALTAMSKAATVFVNYLSQAANTTAAYSTRKTIAPEAVIEALDEIEFAEFVPRVQAELKRFNEVQTGKRNEYRRKLKEKEADKGDGVGGPADGEERAAKRVRRDGAAITTTTGGGARGSIGGIAGTATPAKATQALRGKEDKIAQKAADDDDDDNEQAEEDGDVDVDVTGAAEELEAEQEVEGGQVDEDGSEAEGAEDDDEEEEEEDSSDAEQEEAVDLDVDDADLRERAIRRGRRGEYGGVDDDDDATSSGGSEGGASETESDGE